MSTANPSRPSGRSFRLVCPPEQMPQVENLLHAQGYAFEPEPFSPLCRRLLCEPRPLGSSLAAFFGYIYIQDRSSMLPPLALAPRQGQAVLDMCASPGSKTGFLGQLTGPDGFVLGNELSRARLATLRANLHACNLPHVGTCSFEGQALPLTPGTWDAIQLDPPCSGWGTVEKNPQVLKLWQGDKLKGLVGLQRLLLAHAARLLRPGGRVVFSTCTTNDDENEAQVRFAEEELGLVREPLTPFEGFVWEQRPGGEGTLRVDGERSAAQGFYVALLRKPADAPLPELPPVPAGPDARPAAATVATPVRPCPWARWCPAAPWPGPAAIPAVCPPARPASTASRCASSRPMPTCCCRRASPGRGPCWAAWRAAACTWRPACAACCPPSPTRRTAWCWTTSATSRPCSAARAARPALRATRPPCGGATCRWPG